MSHSDHQHVAENGTAALATNIADAQPSGSRPCRVALGALVRAAREIQEEGTFGFARDALPYAEANRFMRETAQAGHRA